MYMTNAYLDAYLKI